MVQSTIVDNTRILNAKTAKTAKSYNPITKWRLGCKIGRCILWNLWNPADLSRVHQQVYMSTTNENGTEMEQNRLNRGAIVFEFEIRRGYSIGTVSNFRNFSNFFKPKKTVGEDEDELVCHHLNFIRTSYGRCSCRVSCVLLIVTVSRKGLQ